LASEEIVHKTSIPWVALILGIAGLIPFVAGAWLSVSADTASRATGLRWLTAYAAVIVSFLGGVKWGVLLPDRSRFDSFGPAVISVLPSILAWIALLLPMVPMLSLLLAGLIFQSVLDGSITRFQADEHLPAWYAKLRLMLSTGAVFCVGVGLYTAL